ncbi:MAG: M48 family metallopeptidase [Pseudomonadales bacterium]|nr:M48 family metallopeptidase [Pseudomonadales bacterium]
MSRHTLLLLLVALVTACTTSPLNRRQVVFYSESEMARQGEQAYREMQSELPVTPNASEITYVQCVADYVIEALDPNLRNGVNWEVTVFDDPQANAFALPGGKIGVYNGLLNVAFNQHQLAAVIAHEVGHVLANHSNERASQSALRNVGITAARVLGASDTAIEAVDYGARLGLLLPFNRTQESEADSIGIMLMADAGFDPEQSVALWENMSAEGGPRQPEFLSTHPSPASRMADLRARMEAALVARADAQAKGINPDCVPGIIN